MEQANPLRSTLGASTKAQPRLSTAIARGTTDNQGGICLPVGSTCILQYAQVRSFPSWHVRSCLLRPPTWQERSTSSTNRNARVIISPPSKSIVGLLLSTYIHPHPKHMPNPTDQGLAYPYPTSILVPTIVSPAINHHAIRVAHPEVESPLHGRQFPHNSTQIPGHQGVAQQHSAIHAL